jgi:hypothetical protein
MKGILIKKDGLWFVKWSDLHSFAQGTHWMFHELSHDSNSIKYVKDKQIMYKPLEEGLEVEFELIWTEDFLFPNRAKLIFPEIENLNKSMKKLVLELLDDNGNTVVTHTLDYNENQGKRMRISIDDNSYVMNTSGKFVILTQKEIDVEMKRMNAKQ